MSDAANSKIRVGLAGWSYADWKGIVYPKRAPSGFEPLRYLAPYFDLIEINNSFYRPLDPAITRRWLELIEDLPEFRFTAKMFQEITHSPPAEWKPETLGLIKAGFAPLEDAGRLDAILVQFPFFFDATHEHLDHLARIAAEFTTTPLVLEVRHRSFLRREVLAIVRQLGFSFCGADQPQAKTSIPPLPTVTGRFGYFRLHGRNTDAWFSRSASVAQKYDYLYPPSELAQLEPVIRAIAEQTECTHVVANNHFLGKGVVNALELKASLSGARVDVPEPLIAAYPRLAAISVDHEP